MRETLFLLFLLGFRRGKHIICVTEAPDNVPNIMKFFHFLDEGEGVTESLIANVEQ
jgi:hypothetical protein